MKSIVKIVMVLGVVACTPRNLTQGNKVVVLLDWVPNSNHVGLYVAQALGYFDEVGLDVFILQPPEDGAMDMVLAKQAQLAISSEGNIIFARQQGLPIVATAAILQHNDSGFASLKSKNITRPRDLVGKRYLGWGGAVEEQIILSMMAMDGVENPALTLAGTGALYDFNMLLTNQADYIWVFKGWDALAAELQGVELNMIMMRDYDERLDHYTPFFVSSDYWVQKQPEQMRVLMQAIARGYEYAAANPIEAAGLMLNEVEGLDERLMVASVQHLAPFYVNNEGHFGIMQPHVMERYVAWLVEHGLISESVPVNSFLTNELLVGF
jgi:ABC-type nitrate/sulfonate/bicarbonate transport system substrate-binding protein